MANVAVAVTAMARRGPCGRSGLWLLLSAAFLCMHPPLARSDEAPEVARVRTWLDTHVPDLMRETGLPGFSIAIVRAGETVYAEGYGARDPKKNLPATSLSSWVFQDSRSRSTIS